MTPQERAGLLKAVIQSAVDNINVCIPARVDSLSGADKVNVICAINRGRMQKDGSRDYNQTTVLPNVPVVLPSCGGFSFDMPLSAGCNGLLVFCDYDIDNWKNGGAADPHTARTHSINDPFFFPAFNGTRIDGDNLVIRSPTTRLILGNGFDVEHNGESLIDKLNACCINSFAGWKP